MSLALKLIVGEYTGPQIHYTLKKLTMAVLILHNWLRSGQSKTVYMPPGFCDTHDPTTQPFIPGSWRNENNHNFLI